MNLSAAPFALVSHLAKSGEAVKSGPIGLAVILLLCIACYFLFKSMSKHLRRVREAPPLAPPERPAPTSDSATNDTAASSDSGAEPPSPPPV